MRRILIADDEPGFRDLFVFALEPLGFQVTVVGDGAEAVAQAAARAFDLIVLDVHMPHVNGLQALRQIRELLPNQKVLMISASAEDPRAVDVEARAAGARGCLFKPLELGEIIEAIQVEVRAPRT